MGLILIKAFFEKIFGWFRLSRPVFLFVFFVALFLAPAGAPFAGQKIGHDGVRITPPPDWVTPVRPEEPDKIPRRQLSDGVYFLLTDRQAKVDKSGFSRFRHYALKLIDSKGVEDNSQISMEFDPSFEDLEIHSIEIHRDGEKINALKPERIQVLQRETQREYQIYDGAKTADVILEDVRPGDVVEYSYSINGINPAFDNKYFAGFSTRWSTPTGRIFNRLLWPQERFLYTKVHGEKDLLEKKQAGDHLEYVWDERNVSPLIPDSERPYWFDPWPWVQFSEFKSWKPLIAWGLEKYSLGDPSDPAIKAINDEILANTSTQKEQVAKVLSFVQNEVRYLGIEMGDGGYVPSAPGVTLKRRFGDCKDKALLMACMLRAKQIDAWPVLVNTRRLHKIEDLLPSPFDFNHVIVEVRLGGKKVWLDPTLSHFVGGFDYLFEPDYGQGLVLSPESTGLETQETPTAQAVEEIFESWNFKQGLDSPAVFHVRSLFQGSEAADMRNSFASSSMLDIEKDYLNYYARFYPDIQKTKDLAFVDDADVNRVSVSEQYEVGDGWTLKNGKERIYFYAYEFNSFTDKPSILKRQMPLGVKHPVNKKKETRVRLPASRNIKPKKTVVENDTFRFVCSSECKGRELVLKYHYKTKKDHVPVDEVEDFVADMEEMDDCLRYRLYKKSPKSSKKNSAGEADFFSRNFLSWKLYMLIAIFLGVIILILAGFVYSIIFLIREHKKHPAS